MPEAAERTIAPTQPRRDDARREGRVAHSHDLAAAALLIVGLLALSLLGEQIVSFFARVTERQLGSELLSTAAIDSSTVASDKFDAVVDQGRSLIVEIITVIAPLLGVLLVGAIAANVAQTGFRWLPERLAIDFNRIDPLAGLRRLFSLGGGQRIVMGMLKLACVLLVGYISLWQRREEILNIAALELPRLAAVVVEIAYWTSLKIAVSLLVLAIGDYGYQRWKLERDLQMTPEELREEMRNQQGDPSVLSRRRAMQKQQGIDRVTAATRQANIVVTAGKQLAVAIAYDPAKMPVPIVVAKGTADVAESIRRTAMKYDVPTVERHALTESLYRKSGINLPISDELFDAVAEVVAKTYRYNGQSLERRAA
jgi:flagellar biosynthesis protein FlhB